MVDHRLGVLDPVFEALSYAGSFGFVWLAVAVGISGFSWSRPWLWTRVGASPVIMFSGKVDERSAAEAQSRGVQGFIGKPFDPRSLIESTKQQLPV